MIQRASMTDCGWPPRTPVRASKRGDTLKETGPGTGGERQGAIVNACHGGQGGAGDIAILTAANRMQLDAVRADRHAHWRGHHGDVGLDPARAGRVG